MHSVVHVNLHCRVASSHLHRPRANVERDVHFKKELDFLIYMRRLAAGVKPCLDLSFASKKWQRTVLVKRKGKSWFRRQHLETCVFSCLADELKTGDICCLGSEQFVDYRNQLLPWSECEPKVAAYCHQLGLPATAKGLVEHC